MRGISDAWPDTGLENAVRVGVVEKFASDGSKLRISSAEICPFETTGLD